MTLPSLTKLRELAIRHIRLEQDPAVTKTSVYVESHELLALLDAHESALRVVEAAREYGLGAHGLAMLAEFDAVCAKHGAGEQA